VHDPLPNLSADSPFEVLDAQTLFATGTAIRTHFPGIAALPSGRIVLSFMQGSMPRRNDGATMVSISDDKGSTWSSPRALFARPSWDCFPNGGPGLMGDGRIRQFIGRYRFEPELGGKQPFAGEWATYYTDSADEGVSWSDLSEEVRIFPSWTEMYGASNPLPLSNGRLIWAVSGTLDRDRDWQSGITFSDSDGSSYAPPVLIGAKAGDAYSDGDIVQLSDGRFLAVLREHLRGGTLFSHSVDEGETWTPLRPTGFIGANFKLNRLESGDIVCVYREENPDRRGVSCTVSQDGGESWTWVGHLYQAPADAPHEPGYFCGAPDLEALGDGTYAAVLHTQPDADNEMCLHYLLLRDRS
jgi:hypothetical protein